MARTCCKYFTVGLVPVTALFLALLFAFGVLSLPIIYTELTRKYEYGMVIDAGSSHTSLYLYRLDVPVTGRLVEIYSENSTDSLDSFADNSSGAAKVVTQLIENTKKIKEIPKSLYESTHIYLGATAGMRLLKRKNKTVADAVLKAASDAMSNNSFHFKAHDAEIISGTKEASSGWLTANYLMDTENVGSLDMGGGSTEIAFSAVKPGDSQYYVKEKLVGNLESLYARSYLCYGHNEALGRFLAHLVNNSGDKLNVSNPCLSEGLSLNHTRAEIYTSCVTTNSTAVEVFGFTLSPDTTNNTNITFYGTGNSTQCKDEISKVFNFSACYPPRNCDSDKFEVPPVRGTFVGFTGFYYIAEKLNLHNQIFNYSNTVMEATLNRCNEMLKKNVSGTHEYCFYGLFMAYTMEVGFGMNSSSKNWTVLYKLKGKEDISYGWSLGYFMNHTNSYSDHPNHEVTPYSVVDMVVGMLVLTILCAIFVVFFFLTLYACRKALKTHSGYQTIS